MSSASFTERRRHTRYPVQVAARLALPGGELRSCRIRDFGAGGTAFAALGGTFVFADVAYWWYGDMPELELVDGLTYGIGVSRAFHEGRASVMASFLGAAATIETMKSPASLGLGFGYIPRPGRSFSAGLALGLSESSPDLSVYAGWSLGIN